jgi:hypothetical protein
LNSPPKSKTAVPISIPRDFNDACSARNVDGTSSSPTKSDLRRWPAA